MKRICDSRGKGNVFWEGKFITSSQYLDTGVFEPNRQPTLWFLSESHNCEWQDIPIQPLF